MNILITRPLIDSEDLMGKLFSLGHKIINIPTLRIISGNMKSIDPGEYDAFIFTSANAIRNLKIKNSDKNKLCFCVGAITEKIVRNSGYLNTIVGKGKNNEPDTSQLWTLDFRVSGESDDSNDPYMFWWGNIKNPSYMP